MPDDIREIRISNIDDINGLHECRSIDKLIEIQVGIARMEQASISQAACFQELNARFEEQNKQFQQLLHTPHACEKTHEIARLSSSVEFLKEEHHKRTGQSKWEDRLWAIVQAVLIAAVVAVVLFLMKGGAIT